MSEKDFKDFTVGAEIDSYCTTCKLVLAHQIVALVEGAVEKVICKTCNKQHKYRPNAPKSRIAAADKTLEKKTAAKKAPAKSRKAKDSADKWEKSFATRDLTIVKPYAMDGIFEQGEILDHQKFGHGLVTEVRFDGKMEVLFKDGVKLMVCGRRPQE